MSKSSVVATEWAVLLGLLGGALLVVAHAFSTSGPTQISPFLLMAIVTPLVLRLLGGVPYPTAIGACAIVGGIMVLALLGYLTVAIPQRQFTVLDYVWRIGIAMLGVMIVSAIVGVFATGPRKRT